VDYEVIYDICKNHIPPLKKAIQNIFNKIWWTRKKLESKK
jgi:uncharacterized protein with HEPN domain